MTTKKVLGRGLGALIPGRDAAQPGNALLMIPLDQIAPNPYQPRKTFNDPALDDLARSIQEHGILQPLVVTRHGDRYRLIAGERRYRAAKKAGLHAVPAIVKDLVHDNQALEMALIENIQREDLNPIEEALAYQQLHSEFSLTQEEIAHRVGKERSTVANFLRLLRLPDPVKKLLASGQLSMGHARALLAVENPNKQQQLAERVVRRNLNVRQTELLASGGTKVEKKEPKQKDVFTRDAEEKLTRILRTRVEIDRRRRGGTIQIRFSSEEDLIRLFEDLSTHGRKR
jgi:ParB family chromosome partitioning protein